MSLTLTKLRITLDMLSELRIDIKFMGYLCSTRGLNERCSPQVSSGKSFDIRREPWVQALSLFVIRGWQVSVFGDFFTRNDERLLVFEVLIGHLLVKKGILPEVLCQMFVWFMSVRL